jgi:hypothetical protein
MHFYTKCVQWTDIKRKILNYSEMMIPSLDAKTMRKITAFIFACFNLFKAKFNLHYKDSVRTSQRTLSIRKTIQWESVLFVRIKRDTQIRCVDEIRRYHCWTRGTYCNRCVLKGLIITRNVSLHWFTNILHAFTPPVKQISWKCWSYKKIYSMGAYPTEA